MPFLLITCLHVLPGMSSPARSTGSIQGRTPHQQQRDPNGHFFAVWDKHTYCPTCRDKKRGEDPCVRGLRCSICDSFTPEQKRAVSSRRTYQEKMASKRRHAEASSSRSRSPPRSEAAYSPSQSIRSKGSRSVSGSHREHRHSRSESSFQRSSTTPRYPEVLQESRKRKDHEGDSSSRHSSKKDRRSDTVSRSVQDTSDKTSGDRVSFSMSSSREGAKEKVSVSGSVHQPEPRPLPTAAFGSSSQQEAWERGSSLFPLTQQTPTQQPTFQDPNQVWQWLGKPPQELLDAWGLKEKSLVDYPISPKRKRGRSPSECSFSASPGRRSRSSARSGRVRRISSSSSGSSHHSLQRESTPVPVSRQDRDTTTEVIVAASDHEFQDDQPTRQVKTPETQALPKVTPSSEQEQEELKYKDKLAMITNLLGFSKIVKESYASSAPVKKDKTAMVKLPAPKGFGVALSEFSKKVAGTHTDTSQPLVPPNLPTPPQFDKWYGLIDPLWAPNELQLNASFQHLVPKDKGKEPFSSVRPKHMKECEKVVRQLYNTTAYLDHFNSAIGKLQEAMSNTVTEMKAELPVDQAHWADTLQASLNKIMSVKQIQGSALNHMVSGLSHLAGATATWRRDALIATLPPCISEETKRNLRSSPLLGSHLFSELALSTAKEEFSKDKEVKVQKQALRQASGSAQSRTQKPADRKRSQSAPSRTQQAPRQERHSQQHQPRGQQSRQASRPPKPQGQHFRKPSRGRGGRK